MQSVMLSIGGEGVGEEVTRIVCRLNQKLSEC